LQRSCRDGGAVLSRCRGGLSEVIVQVHIVRFKGSVQRCKCAEVYRGPGAECRGACAGVAVEVQKLRCRD